MIEIVIGYMLMLVAMTFNIYLLLAIIIGNGIGHFLFARK